MLSRMKLQVGCRRRCRWRCVSLSLLCVAVVVVEWGDTLKNPVYVQNVPVCTGNTSTCPLWPNRPGTCFLLLEHVVPAWLVWSVSRFAHWCCLFAFCECALLSCPVLSCPALANFKWECIIRYCSRTSEHLSMGLAHKPPTQGTTLSVLSVLSCPPWRCTHRMCVITKETGLSP